MKIFIPGNMPSSKNSRQWTGKFFVVSKTVSKYERATKHLWKQWAYSFRAQASKQPKPLRVHFRFVRDSRRKFDYINAAQLAQDLMVKNGWIPDDNCDEMIPVFELYGYDKNNAGTEIWVE